MGDEADEIVLLALRRGHMPVPKAMKSMKDTTPEGLVAIVVHALRAINASVLPADFSDKLPVNMAQRHRMTTAIAGAVREVGFMGDMGYNQLLYPNERDSRRLLSWLVSKLPRADEEDGGAGGGGPGAALSSVLLRNMKKFTAPGASSAAAVVASASAASAALPSTVAVPAVSAATQRLRAAAAMHHASGPSASSSASTAAIAASISSSLRAAAGLGRSSGLGAGATVLSAAIGGADAAVAGGGDAIHAAAAAQVLLTTAPGPALLAHPVAVAAQTQTLESIAGTGGAAGGAAAASGNVLSWLSLELVAAGIAHRKTATTGSSGASTAAPPLFPGTFLDTRPSAFTRTCAFAVSPAVYGGALAISGAGAKAAAAADSGVKTEEEIAAEREAEIAAMNARLEALLEDIARLADQHRTLTETLPVLAGKLKEANAAREGLERRFLVRRACLDMLPEAAEHITRLANEIAASSNGLLALAEEWETHRLPLVNAIAAALEARGAAVAEADRLAAGIADVRSQMGELASSMAAKEELAAKLAAEWARLKEAIPGLGDATGGSGYADGSEVSTRPAYTRRIMDIIRQIRKQKAEIGRIVKDVRAVQHEIAGVSDKLGRTTAIAMETMERAATENPKDAAYRQVLRHLLNLQELFNQLVTATSVLGHTENEIRQLENRVEQNAARADARNMDELMRDLAQVRADNTVMEGQLRAAGAASAATA